ncbi:hypothetical protein CRM22_006828 [Opisthorchis felineus]|uniref:Uncharacterized protein n=1 Tax=Opisthorchis felineus TaxID=147828 RepID=A0A4S2LJ43_OPIFE|nr:hypothetical protein CRM22_006828 [Opisthorchis felineus]
MSSSSHQGDETESGRIISEASPYSDSTFSCLLATIIQIREQQTAQSLINGSEYPEFQSSIDSWCNLFSKGFLVSPAASHSTHGPRDDLLFFVDKQRGPGSKCALRVLRKNSPNLPSPGDGSVNWEQTVYLNLLMQYFVYVATVAVCTRTGPQEIQILKKFSETVYASPSRRRMDSKGTREEVVYPNLFFSVENYSELFSECSLRDSECLCVELTAYDLSGRLQGVCFLGTLQYGSLKRFHDSKAAPTSRLDTTTMLKRQFGTTPNNTNHVQSSRLSDVKFMQVLGPQGKGQAEFAISRVNEHPECRCGRTAGLGFMHKCCLPRTCSPNDKVFFESLDHEPITEQPKGSADNYASDWPSTEVLADWYCLSISPEASEPPRSVDWSSFAPLQTVPSSVRSAGGSTETSPIRRWRVPSSADRASVLSLIALENVSDYKNGLAKLHNSRHFRSGSHRHSPRISKILEKFTHPELPNTNSPHAQLPLDVQGGGTEVDVLVGDAVNKSLKRDSLHGPQSCPDRSKRSFGQSLSWFKERRRITSPALNAALTSLSLPSYEILTDLIEVRREPILNISD